MAKIFFLGEFIIHYGPMFSQKTLGLLLFLSRIEHSKFPFVLIGPLGDTRGEVERLQNHDGSLLSFDCPIRRVPDRQPEEILEIALRERAMIVFIDEIQFFDSGIIQVIRDLISHGIAICAAGLNYNFKGEFFGSMRTLIDMADVKSEHFATCSLCKKENAIYSFRKYPYEEEKIPGGAELYAVACGSCYTNCTKGGILLPEFLDHKGNIIFNYGE